MERKGTFDVPPSCGCCGGFGGGAFRGVMDRRQFLAAAGTVAFAGAGLGAAGEEPARTSPSARHRRPARRELVVQPVFQCDIYERKPATSWRVTGAIQNETELREEEGRIRRDLADLAAKAGFSLKILPLVTVRTVEQAAAITKTAYDVMLIFAARRNLPVLEALAAPSPSPDQAPGSAPDRWVLMFVRHRSGPLYYMYIGSHTHFLRKRRDEMGQPNMDVRDIVVDDLGEILWRLRSLYAVKDARGKRIVAIGGPGGWGAEGAEAPDRARSVWNLDIRDVPYPQLEERLRKAYRDEALVARCRDEAEAYLRDGGVTLETERPFFDKAFVLCEVFRDLLDEAEADAITVNNCMSTIMPISGTTACLPLTLLNDDGFLAFCESDFVAIPAGILLNGISGTPVFLCNPSLPHRGVVTVSHCTAPRRMDGRTLDAARILTHYESDFGAAPKVEMRKGQAITAIDPDFSMRRWLGFEAEILDTPFFPICRTQLDLGIRGDWERLADEIRGFHWIVAYGKHLREVGYAVRKAGLEWFGIA